MIWYDMFIQNIVNLLMRPSTASLALPPPLPPWSGDPVGKTAGIVLRWSNKTTQKDPFIGKELGKSRRYICFMIVLWLFYLWWFLCNLIWWKPWRCIRSGWDRHGGVYSWMSTDFNSWMCIDTGVPNKLKPQKWWGKPILHWIKRSNLKDSMVYQEWRTSTPGLFISRIWYIYIYTSMYIHIYIYVFSHLSQSKLL